MAGLKLIRRNGIYYATGTVAGQRVRKSLGVRDKEQAEELRAHYETTLWKQRIYGDESVRTFEEAALSYMEAGGERRFLPPLIRHFRGRVVGSIQSAEIRQAARLIFPTATGSTRNRQVVTPVRAILNHAAELGWCPPITVRGFRVSSKQRSSVDRGWIDAFLAQADHDGLGHLSAIVLLMWQTGARVGEAVKVLPEHLRLEERKLLLEKTKTGEDEICYLTNELVRRIERLPLRSGTPVFGYRHRFGVAARMKAVCRRAGLPYASPHQAGRHSYATNSFALGATLPEVMRGGRWKTSKLVLETYAHADNAGRSIADRFDTELAQQKQKKR